MLFYFIIIIMLLLLSIGRIGKVKNSTILLFSMICLCFFATIRSLDIGNDTKSYYDLFNSIANGIIKARNDYSENAADYYAKCKRHVLDMYSWEHIAEKSFYEMSRLVSEIQQKGTF